MLIALLALLAAPARIVAADGHWAALERTERCEAVSASLAPARDGQPQARVALLFDARRGGELAVQLSRPPRGAASIVLTVGDQPFLLAGRGGVAWSRGPAQEAALIAALRGATSMRVEARDAGGGRIVDRYSLVGAPTAIDAAAACAARLATR